MGNKYYDYRTLDYNDYKSKIGKIIFSTSNVSSHYFWSGDPKKVRVIYKTRCRIIKPYFKDAISVLNCNLEHNEPTNTVPEKKIIHCSVPENDVLSVKEMIKKIIKNSNSKYKYIGLTLIGMTNIIEDRIVNDKKISKFTINEIKKLKEKKETESQSIHPSGIVVINKTNEICDYCFGVLKGYELYLMYEYRIDWKKVKIGGDECKPIYEWQKDGYILERKLFFLSEENNTIDQSFFKSINKNYYGLSNLYKTTSERLEGDYEYYII